MAKKGKAKSKARAPKNSMFSGAGLQTDRDIARERAKIAGEGKKGFLSELSRQAKNRPIYQAEKRKNDAQAGYTGQDIAERRKEIPSPRMMKDDPSKAEKDNPSKGLVSEVNWNSLPKG